MEDIIRISNLSKRYASGFEALKDVSLNIRQGELFALLGPNGAGKTTLINIVCGIVNKSSGTVAVGGFDHVKQYRAARDLVGLVPQELTTDTFETVWNTVQFSRALFGKPHNPAYLETVLKSLSLWDKKDNKVMTLSGGMKRRLMIAKALSHEPKILFLDEPSAGVDVELRKNMWQQVRALRQSGVTIILTTHYIEEAEEMADRVGVISNGAIIVVEEKKTLMKEFGKKELRLEMYEPITRIPESLSQFNLQLEAEGTALTFTYDTKNRDNGIADLLDRLKENGIRCRDLDTKQSSLEEIFVELVNKK